MIAPGGAWAADRGSGGGRGQRKVRAELGEPGVQGDQAAVDEDEHGERGERLRGAADLEQRMAADLGETVPLSQGVQARRKPLRIRHIKKEAQGVQVSPLNPLSVAP